ncbi:MAG: MFS transporter, partial [Oscillospiraceae bacterium]
LVGAYLVFSLVYLGFAFVSSSIGMVVIFIIYGFYTAMISGAERAMITEISPPHLKGTMLGLQSTIVGIALLPASVIAGVLWDTIGVAAPFVFGAALSLVAAIMLIILLNKKTMQRETD